MNPKIVITGITSFRNHGVEALVVSTIAQVRERFPGATFTVLDRAAEYDASRLRDPGVRFVQDHTIRPLVAGGLRKLITRTLPSLDRHAQMAADELRSATCVIASGGDVFCSEYGHRSLLSHLQPLKIARRAGIPFILHAQSIGPFTTGADRSAFTGLARDAAAITVREAASFRYITEDLKLPASICHLVADPAFLLTQPEAAEGGALFAHYRGREGRPTVALSTSQAICHWMQSDADRHVETWLEVIRWLRSELDANVILIPHVQELSDRNEDRVLATAIQRRLGHDPHVRLAGGDFSAGDYKAIISRCDFVVAERMHAAIAGLSTAVPTLVIGYSIKAEGILSDLLGNAFAKENALISIQDFMAPGRGLAAVQNAWAKRDEIRRLLTASLPAARARSRSAYDCIQEVCLRRQPSSAAAPAASASLAPVASAGH